MASCLLRFVFWVVVCSAVWQLGSAGNIYGKAWLAQQLLERAWEKILAGEANVRPWPWADTWPIAKLTIPRLGISQIVMAGDSGRVLAFGPGYTEASAQLGEQGVTLISGHRDTSFRFMKELQQGDTIALQTSEQTLRYSVIETGVVDQREFRLNIESPPVLSQSNQSQGKPSKAIQLMLVTCYPFDALQAGGDERYIVLAQGMLSGAI